MFLRWKTDGDVRDEMPHLRRYSVWAVQGEARRQMRAVPLAGEEVDFCGWCSTV